MARVALVLGSRGTLKTLTLSAIPIDDYIDSVLKSRAVTCGSVPPEALPTSLPADVVA